jgi:rhamnulokinase
MLTYSLTNEGGVNGMFRLLKNIVRLWLVQEGRREWERAGEDYGYGEMV